MELLPTSSARFKSLNSSNIHVVGDVPLCPLNTLVGSQLLREGFTASNILFTENLNLRLSHAR
jgi:hypothetical protein